MSSRRIAVLDPAVAAGEDPAALAHPPLAAGLDDISLRYALPPRPDQPRLLRAAYQASEPDRCATRSSRSHLRLRLPPISLPASPRGEAVAIGLRSLPLNVSARHSVHALALRRNKTNGAPGRFGRAPRHTASSFYLQEVIEMPLRAFCFDVFGQY